MSSKRIIILENIVYKNFRNIKLNSKEQKIAQEVVEIKDYGKILD